MIKRNVLIAITMFIALFIYTFYRTDCTLINQLWIYLFTQESFTALKSTVRTAMPLPELIVYSLPEALWIFTITLTSKNLFFKIRDQKIFLYFLPLVFCVGMELLQYAGITNGHFDFWDIGLSLLFWFLGILIPLNTSKFDILKAWNKEVVLCIISYGVVYLAHTIVI